MKFDQTGEIVYPLYIDEVAGHLGKLRQTANQQINSTISLYSRGDQAEAIDILGIKGELVVQHFLFSKNIPFTSSKILDDKPIANADIVLGDKIRIDVKAVHSGSSRLLVNEVAHKKAKNITHYWFIKPIENGKVKYWIFKHEEIDEWSLIDSKFTSAYAMPFDHLIKHNFN